MIHFRGYSLIELVMVLMIAAILGAVSIGRFADSSSYDRRSIQEFWLGVLRQVQQVALARAADNQALLWIGSSSGEWRVDIRNGSGVLPIQSLASEGLLLYQGTTGSADCAGMAVITTAFTLAYDGDGNLEDRINHAFCINTDPPLTFCVSASGYAYEGLCQSR
jgi:prepilin-type N-terminal cleavage/methylation domain-containing protein